MTNRTKTQRRLDDAPAPVRARLAAAWASFMFLSLYVDFFNRPAATTSPDDLP